MSKKRKERDVISRIHIVLRKTLSAERIKSQKIYYFKAKFNKVKVQVSTNVPCMKKEQKLCQEECDLVLIVIKILTV